MSDDKRKQSEVLERVVAGYGDELVNVMKEVSEIQRSVDGASYEAVSTSASDEINEIGEENFTLSRKLQRTILNIKEGSGYVRQYRKRHTNEERSLEQYMCQTCFNLQWSGRNLLELPVVRVKHGKIVGSAHPLHDERCEPVKLEEAIAVAEDREGRLRVRQGLQKPRTAFEEAYKRCVNADAQRYLPDWNRVKSAYYHHQNEGKKCDSTSTSSSNCSMKSGTVTLQREERAEITSGYDGGENKEGECSTEKDHGISDTEMKEISSDFDNSVLQPTSALKASSLNLSESSLEELETDGASRILEDDAGGSSNPEEASSNVNEAVVGTPPTDEICNQTSHRIDEVAQLQPIQQVNFTEIVRIDNQSESPTAQMLQSNQNSSYEEAHSDESSSSQLAHPNPSESHDNDDGSNQLCTDNEPSQVINKRSPQKRKCSNIDSEHFMKRDPRTGRIALCTRVPVSSSIKRPLLIEQQQSPTPNTLSKKFTRSPLGAVVKSKPNNSISSSCCTPRRVVKKSLVRVKEEDRIIVVDDSTDSSVEKCDAKTKHSVIRDDCDAIGHALANLIREVEGIDKCQGTKLKIDILRTMSRYRCSVRYAQ